MFFTPLENTQAVFRTKSFLIAMQMFRKLKSKRKTLVSNLQSPIHKRYKELDSLRGLAAMLVVFFHFTWGCDKAGFIFWYGNAGVDLFFMISGFVIFLSLNNVNNVTEFAIHRVARLFPTYWTCVTFTYILHVTYFQFVEVDFGMFSIYSYLVNMTMLQFYLHEPNLDQPYWTMIIELLFYVLMAGLYYFRLFRRINMIAFVSTASLAILANFVQSTGISWLFRWIPVLTYLPLFFAGIVFYKIYHRKGSLLSNYLLLLSLLLCELWLFDISGRLIFLGRAQYTIVLLVFFMLFILFVHGRLKFIAAGWMLFLGRISFALYLTHQFLSVNILLPLLTEFAGLSYWIAVIITLPIVILVAAIITFYVEKPLSAKMKSWLKRKLLAGPGYAGSEKTV